MKIVSFILIAITLGLLSNGVFADKYKGEYEAVNKSTKSLSAGCTPATASTYLELNNVRALIHTGGDMWWDLQGTAKYEIPKGSGKTSLFAGSIWIGGLDVNNQLKIAAMRFRQDGVDYWPGPLITSGSQQASVSDTVCRDYDKHFVVSKAQVSEFRAYMNSTSEEQSLNYPGYSIPQIILDWPAHGDYTNGYPYYLAPFYDVNEDGSYDPYSGDYPFFDLDGTEVCGTSREQRKVRLYGDQTLWWVYNDKGNIHTESEGEAIGMELHGQAFAFSTNDELNNMTFYNYEIINRSTYTLTNTYFGVWTDADLGDATDDYVGCDVNRGLGFLYNGDAVDGDGQTQAYGENPPAIGVDFFEGPYQDPDGEDNLSSWDNSDQLDCENGYRYNPSTDMKELVGPGDINNGNINGLNFGDGIVDNERWGMRRYIYFNNTGGGAPPATTDPHTAWEHYNLLLGKWKTGDPLLYGGNGYNTQWDGDFKTDFMFPGDTDPCGWGQGGIIKGLWSENQTTDDPNNPSPNPADDRRFVQSAGPFVLEPGMINDITTGIVWARGESGPVSSVEKVKSADNKAQKLFEACFKVLDGPDAPELSVVEMDKEFIFHIWNKKTSNNYLEAYYAKDPFIECPIDENGVTTECDKFFKFQGYQVFQLKDKTVSVADLHDPSKAVLVFQCDVKDGVSQIVNYEWSDELGANIPTEEVNGSDDGVVHTFKITEDEFATGDRVLVNHKKYYYLAIAYAHNNFKTYSQLDGESLDGQVTPYKAGRKTADGKSISAVEVIPHKVDNMNGGTILNSSYGDVLAITQIDGYGAGYNTLDLEDETIDAIMAGEPWRTDTLKYKKGYGPIKIKVIDPLNVPKGNFILKMEIDSVRIEDGYFYANSYFQNDSTLYDPMGYIYDTKWLLIDNNDGSLFDTITSESWISLENEQIVSELGLSITISQSPYPLAPQAWAPKQPEETKLEADNEGYITASIEYADPSKPWLDFLPDGDGHDFQDWIKSGSENYDNKTEDKCARLYNDRPVVSPLFPVEDALVPLDPSENFEKVLDGKWAPFRLTSTYFHGPGEATSLSTTYSKERRLSNVDIIFTSDKSKWTRCPVLETTDNDIKIDSDDCTVMESTTNSFSEGNASKFSIRKSPSIDKEGNPWTGPADSISTNPEDANYIYGEGMGWFPGYAIDVETGERLNMMYGEESRLITENGRDMKWNPTGNIATDLYYYSGGAAGEVLMGGKHFIYVLGHNEYLKSNKLTTGMCAYDAGDTARYLLTKAPSTLYKKEVFKNCMWVSIPITNPNYDFLACDVKVKLRVVSPYKKRVGTLAYHPDTTVWIWDTVITGTDTSLVQKITKEPAVNKNMPMYLFSTDDVATTTGDANVLEEALSFINVVPNPYYGYNEYELSQIDYAVRITNLPQECTVSIYSVNGTLIRRYEKDSPDTYIQWDLKNSYNITIAGGVYIIHVEVPGVGEKVLKWFGALRPIDLNAF